jgi:hypothetical protein
LSLGRSRLREVLLQKSEDREFLDLPSTIFDSAGTPELIRPLFLLQAIEMLLYYFVASEIGIANTIQRVSTLASVAWAFCGDALTSKLPLRILSAL